jgi:hypothetical protein
VIRKDRRVIDETVMDGTVVDGTVVDEREKKRSLTKV